MLNIVKVMSERSIIWFRKGLRLHDNPALLESLKGNVEACYPIFILDPEYVNESRVCVNRFGFLLESLHDLDEQLKKRKSRLLVYQGKPHEVIPKIIKEHKITRLCFESDTEPYAKLRDEKISKLACDSNVKVFSPVSHTLYDPERLLAKNNDQVPASMQGFLGLVSKVGKPLEVAENPPDFFPPSLNIKADLNVPTLKDLGYCGTKTTFLIGGERKGLEILDNYLENTKKVIEFEKPKTNPASLQPDTTSLSSYLKFGCISPRLFYYKLNAVYEKAKGKHTRPPVSLLGQLYWREMFYLNAYKIPNFDKICGNKICRRIDWDHNETFIKAWEEGRTGYPWIDACMKQLHQHGWLHHLARHSVACFLTRGDLYQSWEHGAAVFDKYLVDADWSLNNANWMWLSASAFFHQYFRVYSPVAFPKNFDKEGLFVKHYIPKLKKFPTKYIYEPWKAPLSVQKQAGCIIGKDYPQPIVDHSVISKVNINRMKAAYGRKLYGNSLTHPMPESPCEVQTGSVGVTGQTLPSSASNKGESSKIVDCSVKKVTESKPADFIEKQGEGSASKNSFQIGSKRKRSIETYFGANKKRK